MSAKKFKREVLLRAPRFAKYQQDFLGAVLCKSEYTIAEADKAVEEYRRVLREELKGLEELME